MLQKVWSLTEAEVAKGTSGPGMTLKALEAKYGKGAAMRRRVIARHGVLWAAQRRRARAAALCCPEDTVASDDTATHGGTFAVLSFESLQGHSRARGTFCNFGLSQGPDFLEHASPFTCG